MKKIFAAILGLMFITTNVNAVSLDSIVSSVLSSIDSQFNNLFKTSIKFIERCFNTKFDFGIDNTDLCAFASELDKLNVNICSAFGGNVTVGVSGFNRLCNAMARDFQYYISRQAADFMEYAILQDDDLSNLANMKLPNGMKLSNFNYKWDVNALLKETGATNAAHHFLRDGRMKELKVMRNYAKSASNSDQKDPKDIKIEDIKVPETLNDYYESMIESTQNVRAVLTDASPSSTATKARAILENGNSVSDLAGQEKPYYDQAKILEMEREIAAQDFDIISVPTQEYVNSLRSDLKISAIAQIQAQQAKELAIRAAVEEKWQRKYNIAKLLIDKESILAQTFDESSAKDEINSIANSGW